MPDELQPTAKQLENALKRIADLEGAIAELKKLPEPVKESTKPDVTSAASTPAPAPKKKREKLFKFNLFGPLNEDNS